MCRPSGAGHERHWYAVDRAEIAVRVGPFVPDRDPVLLQPADVRVAPEKPQQLVDHRPHVHLLRGHERKAVARGRTAAGGRRRSASRCPCGRPCERPRRGPAAGGRGTASRDGRYQPPRRVLAGRNRRRARSDSYHGGYRIPVNGRSPAVRDLAGRLRRSFVRARSSAVSRLSAWRRRRRDRLRRQRRKTVRQSA